jgi:hypothetical protein
MTDQITSTEASDLQQDNTTNSSYNISQPDSESTPTTPQEQQQQSESSSSSSSTTSSLQQCTNCHSQSQPSKPLKPCLKCHSAHYCSRDCQKADLKQHKKKCAAAAQIYAQTADLKPVTNRAPPKEGYQKGLRKWQFDT